jgi:hypothetical protein
MASAIEGNFEYGEVIATPPGLISFPNVWEAVENQYKAGKLEFSCSIMIPKQGADLAFLNSEAMKPVQRLWGDKIKKLSQLGNHCPIKDGDLDKDGMPRDEDHPAIGHWVIKATAGKMRRPFVVDKNNRPVSDHEEIYGGAIGQLWVKPMAYDMKVGKGVKFILEGVQKIADGKPFGTEKFDPAKSGHVAPDVPAYLRDRMEVARPAFGGRNQAPIETEADRAMKRAVTAVTAGFNGDVDGDDATPF